MAESEVKLINGRSIADTTAREAIEELKQYSWVSADSPLVLDADKAEDYNTLSTYGDKALKAIQEGRQILVRVPNADGGNFTAIYSPVLMYQLPNYENNYLYLFYLRDEKQDLSSLLGQTDGTIQMPVYGELQMLLSETYNGSPLGQPYINTSPAVSGTTGTKPVFFISAACTLNGYKCFALAYYDNPSTFATVEDVVDAYMAGNAYFFNHKGSPAVGRIIGFSISNNDNYGGEVVTRYVDPYGQTSNYALRVYGSTEADLNAAMAKYLP